MDTNTGFVRKPDLDNKDHDFSKWLRSHGWDYDYKNVSANTCAFYSNSGVEIARAIYDNVNITFSVLVAEIANG